MISIKSPIEIQLDLAQGLKSKRKWRGHSRAEASRLTGVPAPTLRKFENTGEISLRQFMMLTHVYGDLSIFENAFPHAIAKSMNELIKQNAKDKGK